MAGCECNSPRESVNVPWGDSCSSTITAHAAHFQISFPLVFPIRVSEHSKQSSAFFLSYPALRQLSSICWHEHMRSSALCPDGALYDPFDISTDSCCSAYRWDVPQRASGASQCILRNVHKENSWGIKKRPQVCYVQLDICMLTSTCRKSQSSNLCCCMWQQPGLAAQRAFLWIAACYSCSFQLSTSLGWSALWKQSMLVCMESVWADVQPSSGWVAMEPGFGVHRGRNPSWLCFGTETLCVYRWRVEYVELNATSSAISRRV